MSNKRLSIGIFIDTFFPMIDGVVIAVDNYAKRLSKDFDVIVFAPKIHNQKFKDQFPYEVIRCNTTKVPFTEYELSLPLVDYRFRRRIRKADFDIIHIHSPFTIGKMGVRYAKKHHIPVVGTFHSHYKQDFLIRKSNEKFSNLMIKKIMRVFNQCDLCLAVNQKVADVYKEYGATVPTIVRNNGTDLEYYDNQQEVDKLKQQYGISKNEIVFLFVGRMDVVKNIPFILDVMEKLDDLHFNYKMLMIGTGPNLADFVKIVENSKINNKVIFVGKVVDRVLLSKYYKLANLFVFPSLYDASSLVQIEAASQKTPSIFIEGAVTADTIEKNWNGYTANNQIDDFANEIIRIFSDMNSYQEVCNRAFNDLFVSWDSVVALTVIDYLNLIKENHRKTN